MGAGKSGTDIFLPPSFCPHLSALHLPDGITAFGSTAARWPGTVTLKNTAPLIGNVR
jgi:hypothetical protein